MFISEQFESFPDYHWDKGFARAMTYVCATRSEWTRDLALTTINL